MYDPLRGKRPDINSLDNKNENDQIFIIRFLE